MRELDRLDERFGLGAMPPGRPSRRPGGVRRTGVRIGVGVGVGLALVTLLAFAPGPGGTAFRSLTGINEASRVLPLVTAPPTDEPYAFSQTLPDGDPVTYDPCRSIHYAVNLDNAPSDASSFLAPAIAAAQEASGLQFINDGATSDRWSSRQRGLSRRPVLITFNDTTEVPGLRGDTVGLGGSTSTTSDGQTAAYVTGSIALDATWFRRGSAAGQTSQQQAIVMHELGHVLGLDHVDDPRELMFRENVGVVEYAAGDRAGLARLGAGKCR
jgi:hypothetical protein